MTPIREHFICGIILSLLVAMFSSLAVAAESDRVDHPPIEILADSDFTEAKGVSSGDGTTDDPYIINNLTINATDTAFGILIKDTEKHFRIENCHVSGAQSVGIKLVNVHKPALSNSKVTGNHIGLFLDNAQQCKIQGNNFIDNEYAGIIVTTTSRSTIDANRFGSAQFGVTLINNSKNNTFTANTFTDCSLGIAISTIDCGGNTIVGNDFFGCRATSNSYNRWDKDEQGNYWSKYRGTDSDGDGIGDTPYRILGDAYERDRYPVMEPFFQQEEQ